MHCITEVYRNENLNYIMNQKVTRNFRFFYLPKSYFIISTALCFQANVVTLISSAVVNLKENIGVSNTIKIMSLIYIWCILIVSYTSFQ